MLLEAQNRWKITHFIAACGRAYRIKGSSQSNPQLSMSKSRIHSYLPPEIGSGEYFHERARIFCHGVFFFKIYSLLYLELL